MAKARIWVEEPLTKGSELTLPKGAAHHLSRVLRSRIKDQVTLFNGDGFDYCATIKAITRDKTVVVINNQSGKEAPCPIDIHLGLAISKGQRMDFAIQKAVELGVNAITPLITSRTVVRLNAEKAEQRKRHWQQIVIAACEQSGRRSVPQVYPVTKLEAWIENHEVYGIVLDPSAQTSLADLTKPEEPLYLVAGPEGGLSSSEIDLLGHKGFNRVRLGPRVLRTETAPLAAIAAIQMRWGDFS